MEGFIRSSGAARLGQRERVEQFVAACYPGVWRLCAALVDEGAADDLAQETFLRATRALPGFRGQADTRTWILAIARHVCMDELRGRYRRGRRDTRLAAVSAFDAVAGDPAGEVATNDLLAHLDPDRRAAFVLTQMFSLSYDEAAAVCGCPPGTIRSRVARARGDLIELLGREHAARDTAQR